MLLPSFDRDLLLHLVCCSHKGSDHPVVDSTTVLLRLPCIASALVPDTDFIVDFAVAQHTFTLSVAVCPVVLPVQLPLAWVHWLCPAALQLTLCVA